jgi:hypothetical protein
VDLNDVLQFVNTAIRPREEAEIRSNAEKSWIPRIQEKEEAQGIGLPGSITIKEAYIRNETTKILLRQNETVEAHRAIRTVFDRIIQLSDTIENILADKSLRPAERARKAEEQAEDLVTVFREIPREFNVRVRPHSRLFQKDDPVNAVRGRLVVAEKLFSLSHLSFDVRKEDPRSIYWKLWQGITKLDDVRRIRRCAGFGPKHGPKHDIPYYFLRKKVQHEERHFCSDACRNYFNYSQPQGDI